MTPRSGAASTSASAWCSPTAEPAARDRESTQGAVGRAGTVLDVRIRRLLVHEAAGFAESGMSVSVSYDPTPKKPLGFTARFSSALDGNAMRGTNAL